MSLRRGAERLFNAKMQLTGSDPKPTPASRFKGLGFINLFQTKDVTIKLARGSLRILGAGKLYVMKVEDHEVNLLNWASVTKALT
jgi:hypothetical protein